MCRPHAVELEQEIPPERLSEFRNLSCPRYEHCLDRACRLGWASWSCQRCQLYWVENPDPRPEAVVLVRRRGKPARTTLGALRKRLLRSRQFHQEHLEESRSRARQWWRLHPLEALADKEARRAPSYRRKEAKRVAARRAGWRPPKC
jgi:hypothetical protein